MCLCSQKEHPSKSQRNPLYPIKIQLVLHLRQEFKENHGEIKITAILANTLYGEVYFM